MMETITLESLRELLESRFGGVLQRGHHHEDGQVCVRELRAVVIAAPWSDHPDGKHASATDRACQILNDAPWGSDQARTESCLPLALLSEAAAPAGWVTWYAELTIRRVVPMALRAAADVHPDAGHADAMRVSAAVCEEQGTKASAYAAAYTADASAYAAAYAADASAYAATYAADASADAARAAACGARAAAHASADAARAAACGARAAAYAADAADEPLRVSVACLLEAHGRADLIPAIGAREG